MLLSVLIAVSLAACASMCVWMWHQSFIANGRHTTVSWALGGLAFGALIATTVAIVSLIQQQTIQGAPTAPQTPVVPNIWPAQVAREHRPVFHTLKLAQDAIKKNDLQLALDLARQAEAVPHRTAREDYSIAQLLTYLHFQMKDEDATLAAIDAQLRYPALQPAQRATLLRTAAQSRFLQEDFAAALGYAHELLTILPKDRAMRVLLIQSLFRLDRYEELEPAVDALIRDEQAAGADIPVSWLQMKIVIEASKPDGQARALVEELARDFPEHEPALLQNFRSTRGH